MKKLSLKIRDKPEEKLTEDEEYERSVEKNIINLLDINKHGLDEEAKNQARLMGAITKIYKRKLERKNELKLELEVMRDYLAEDMRINPKIWGLKEGKEISEAAINRMIYRDVDFQKLRKEYNKIKVETQEWEWFFEAAGKKDNNIARLYQMWEKNYYR